jgi:hypothetical protein
MKMTTATLPLAALAGASLFTSTTFAATTRSVCPSGCTYPTIQSAIDAAGIDDTILIGKGRYVENLNTEGKRITLQGADRRTTIVDGNGKGTVITSAGGTLVVVSDLTITRGFGDGGGVSVRGNVSLNVRHSIIVSNHSSTNAGGGIALDGAFNLTIFDCAITNNSTVGVGGGLSVATEGSTVDVRDSTFSGNTADTGGAVAVFVQTNHITMDNTAIVHNTARIGGGIFITSDAVRNILDLSNSTVSENSATTGPGGGFYVAASDLNSIHNVISQNVAATDGGGIYLQASFVKPSAGATFTDTYVIMNHAGHEGGGVFTGLDVSTTVGANVIVADNIPDNCPASQTSCP